VHYTPGHKGENSRDDESAKKKADHRVAMSYDPVGPRVHLSKGKLGECDDECRHRGERMDLNDWRLVEERLYGHQPTIGAPNGTNTIHSHID
jgi:hypothetical protein